jgi:CMP-N-acetylneuraminic acid synthetase
MVDDCHPARMYSIEKGRLKKIMDEPKSFLRQDLPPIYHRNGAIYVCKRNLLINESRLTCDEPIPFIMNKEDSINIDDESDLLIADLLITHINSKM